MDFTCGGQGLDKWAVYNFDFGFYLWRARGYCPRRRRVAGGTGAW